MKIWWTDRQTDTFFFSREEELTFRSVRCTPPLPEWRMMGEVTVSLQVPPCSVIPVLVVQPAAVKSNRTVTRVKTPAWQSKLRVSLSEQNKKVKNFIQSYNNLPLHQVNPVFIKNVGLFFVTFVFIFGLLFFAALLLKSLSYFGGRTLSHVLWKMWAIFINSFFNSLWLFFVCKLFIITVSLM